MVKGFALRCSCFPKRFDIFFGLLTLLAFAFCPPVMAQSRTGGSWTCYARIQAFPSPMPSRSMVLLKMLDRWNAHDIDGHLEMYWKSPELLVVVDSEQFNGWQQLHDSYINGYPDRNAMGFIQPKRIQVKLLKPDSRASPHLVVGRFPEFQAKRGEK
jgi:hypothetical protein